MAVQLNPYLSFRDTARPAMEFYQRVFGGDLTLHPFGETPMPGLDPSDVDKVMHGQLQTPDGHVLMGADTPTGMDVSANGTVSLSGDDEPTLRRWWEELSGNGGSPIVPLEKAPWGDTFGMCTDQFGITWMVNILGEGQ
jgi:PhnB protein